MFYRTPYIFPILYPKLLWRMSSRKKEIYLTFDDGPVPGPTEYVLQVLANYNIRATFFCIGHNIQKHPEVFRRILNEQHVIGNHTFNHVKGWQSTTEYYLENVIRCDQIISSSSHTSSSTLFRPPYGRITRAQIKGLTAKKIVMWDVLTRDYDESISAEDCLSGSLSAVRNGSIVVFHDSLKAERNLSYALPRFIDHCLHKGYSFKTLV